MTGERLLSVGIDIGTTTTQLVISRLTLRNEGAAFSVPQFAIAEKEVLYRSAIHFTPLLSDTRIDAAGVREIVAREYAASGFEKSDIQTGAVIITGETARKENAREVLNALSDFAGDFVVATAGPALESVLAGKGSGAQAYSEERQCTVLNLDIGGGTTNLALFENGKLKDTGCLNVGGRLMKFDPDGTLTYLSPVLRPYFDFPIGQRLTEAELQPVLTLLVEILCRTVSGLGGIEDFITDKAITVTGEPLLSFSGGVADLIDGKPREPFAYGDLGVFLGRAIYQSPLCQGRFLRAKETIRATVIGAGSHATELSGSTIFYDRVHFPLKNLPVAALSEEEEALEPPALAEKIRTKTALFSPEGTPTVLALHGLKNPRFSELCKLADGVALGLRDCAETGNPLVIAVRADMGKALGQAVGMLLPEAPLVCLDSVALPEGSYLDIGAPVAGGQVLPVVVKTLALG
ncbi:MAG: ethanolamine ammonia-lyase reactivating factor EutA [Firmicutes bacterium]|nr:ethanolamine ammonia-lyase reactivating factor EutA [Bacillota bacterium]